MIQKMLKLGCVLFLLVLISAPQGFSQVEVFAGYSRLQFNPSRSDLSFPNPPTNPASGSNGWEGSLYLHLIGPFGAVADFSNHYGIAPTQAANFVPQFSDLFGPRVTFHVGPVEPFAHVLFGKVRGEAKVPIPDVVCSVTTGCPSFTVRDNAFATALGGGLNIRATRHLWIRLIQADYLRINFRSLPATDLAGDNTQHDARLSAGLVFRFGRW